MKENNRRVLVVAIAITVLAAIFVSFGLPAITNRIPEVTLADPNQTTPGKSENSLLPVEVTPHTVQSVIATLSRPESYSRSLTVTLYWGERGSGSQRVEIWAAGGFVKTTVTSGSGIQHRLVGDGKLRLWYDGDRTWKEVPAGENTADLAQHIPTYEDVLSVDKARITDASYVVKNMKNCIYIEVAQPDTNTADRYWIETATGLLTACETKEGDKTVYAMEETAFRSPLEDFAAFTLPDGTLAYAPSAVEEESGGEDEQ